MIHLPTVDALRILISYVGVQSASTAACCVPGIVWYLTSGWAFCFFGSAAQ